MLESIEIFYQGKIDPRYLSVCCFCSSDGKTIRA
jgi:hypothetical protein